MSEKQEEEKLKSLLPRRNRSRKLFCVEKWKFEIFHSEKINS